MAQPRADSGGTSPLIRWIHRRRPLLTALIVLAALLHALLDGDRPVDLLDPDGSVWFWTAWAAMTLGVGVRIWGSGNLRKNREITRTGVYRMVRHPLYTGSLLMFLAYFVTLGNPGVGLALFGLLVVGVYYPTMLSEEAHLATHFPGQLAGYRGLPRLVPNPLLLPEALRTDRFTLEAARRNLGLRSLGFLVALPLFLELLALWGR